jgi:hypothetical protein
MPLWFEHFLKGGPDLPETPASALALKTTDGIPALRVAPQSDWPIARCDVYYSTDADPLARFWRSADAVRQGDVFTAKLPVLSLDAPLYAFANVYYTLPKPESLAPLPEYATAVREVCLSSAFYHVTPKELQSAQVRIADEPSRLIDDFTHGWRDWYRFNVNSRDSWQDWTRKVTDPKWRGVDGEKLAITLAVSQTNQLSFVVIENEWRGYRGPKRTFVCEKSIPGGLANDQTILIDLAEFKNTEDGSPLKSWAQIDVLGFCAQFHAQGRPATMARWQGPAPEFKRLQWE